MINTRNTVNLTLSRSEVHSMVEAAYPDLDLRGTLVLFTMTGGRKDQRAEDDDSLTLRWVMDVILEDNE